MSCYIYIFLSGNLLIHGDIGKELADRLLQSLHARRPCHRGSPPQRTHTAAPQNPSKGLGRKNSSCLISRMKSRMLLPQGTRAGLPPRAACREPRAQVRPPWKQRPRPYRPRSTVHGPRGELQSAHGDAAGPRWSPGRCTVFHKLPRDARAARPGPTLSRRVRSAGAPGHIGRPLGASAPLSRRQTGGRGSGTPGGSGAERQSSCLGLRS